MEKLNLNKKLYVKNQYERVIDTKFSQLATTPSSIPSPSSPTISVNDFFEYYNELFFQIPKLGDVNSHEYLIRTSSEYIESITLNSTVQALIEEINSLQQQNLELNQQLIDLQVPTNNNG